MKVTKDHIEPVKVKKVLKSFMSYTACVRHSTAPSYLSIENSFNGCSGHPPLCLPPGTAQRLPDRIQKVFGLEANLFS